GTTSFGLTSMQGWRQTMEDSHLALPHVKELEELLNGREVSLYGVFDGHGGPAVSEWIARHMVPVLARELKATQTAPPAGLPSHFEKDIILLSESLCKTFIELDEEMQTEGGSEEEAVPELHAQVSTDAWNGGASSRPAVPDTCGAAVVLTAIVGGEMPFLITANAGDSRCVLCRDGIAVAQSHDHKPHLYNELNRIVRAGGYIEHGRVDGNLNLSRTLGDLFYKRNKTLRPEQQKITAYPDVMITGITPQDQFIIIACDGIWDCLTNQQACEFVLSRLGDNPTPQHLSAICEEMCDTCLAGHPMDSEGGIGCDNMTCIIVLLNDEFRARGIKGSNSAYYKKPE
ncbi:protein phosphatase 2C, partial [Gregarina niphandrodes]